MNKLKQIGHLIEHSTIPASPLLEFVVFHDLPVAGTAAAQALRIRRMVQRDWMMGIDRDRRGVDAARRPDSANPL